MAVGFFFVDGLIVFFLDSLNEGCDLGGKNVCAVDRTAAGSPSATRAGMKDALGAVLRVEVEPQDVGELATEPRAAFARYQRDNSLAALFDLSVNLTAFLGVVSDENQMRRDRERQIDDV